MGNRNQPGYRTDDQSARRARNDHVTRPAVPVRNLVRVRGPLRLDETARARVRQRRDDRRGPQQRGAVGCPLPRFDERKVTGRRDYNLSSLARLGLIFCVWR
jgi:hypothetical protein